MRLLLDSCVSKAACLYLRSAGHDVEYSAEWPTDPGDAEILARAAAEERALVTVDKDFGDLAVRHGRRHAGIVRLVGFRAGEQGAATDAVVASHSAELARGALLTVERDRVRIREG